MVLAEVLWKKTESPWPKRPGSVFGLKKWLINIITVTTHKRNTYNLQHLSPMNLCTYVLGHIHIYIYIFIFDLYDRHYPIEVKDSYHICISVSQLSRGGFQHQPLKRRRARTMRMTRAYRWRSCFKRADSWSNNVIEKVKIWLVAFHQQPIWKRCDR